jgi:hypothetical protein
MFWYVLVCLDQEKYPATLQRFEMFWYVWTKKKSGNPATEWLLKLCVEDRSALFKPDHHLDLISL